MPKAKKGQRFGGRAKGTPNKKTQMWEEMGAYIVNEGAERYMGILTKLEDKTFADRFERIIEYFKPKLARGENKDEVTINVIDKVLDKAE